MAGLQCVETIQHEYQELDERLNEAHRMLILKEREKYEWTQSKIIFDHIFTTMKALKNSIEMLDTFQLVLDELGKASIASCDLLYILQVSFDT